MSVLNSRVRREMDNLGIIVDEDMSIMSTSPGGSRLIHAKASSNHSGALRDEAKDLIEDDLGLIIRIISEADAPKDGASFPKDIHAPHVVRQVYRKVDDMHVFLRPYVSVPLSERRITAEFANLADDSASPVLSIKSYIRDILLALEAIHEYGIAHGDLRPEKISQSKDGAFEVRDPGVPSIFVEKNSRYVPEDESGLVPSVSSDIYAFFNLALDATSPYRGSRKYSDVAQLDSQLRWLKEYFHQMKKRPSVADLQELLLSQKVPTSHSSNDVLLDAFNDVGRPRISRGSGPVRTFLNYRRRYPETAFEVGSIERSER